LAFIPPPVQGKKGGREREKAQVLILGWRALRTPKPNGRGRKITKRRMMKGREFLKLGWVFSE
jgi:hypothetical protein